MILSDQSTDAEFEMHARKMAQCEAASEQAAASTNGGDWSRFVAAGDVYMARLAALEAP